MKKNWLFFALVVTLCWTACTSEEVEPDETRLGADFYPLEVGNYSIFQVENTDYKVTGEVVTSTYQLKTEVVDSFLNQTGNISYIIHYFKRQSASEDWQLNHAWTARKNANQVVLIEENVPFVKLSFPIKDDKVWDGNILNSLPRDDYQMDSLFSQYITPGQDTIANTLTIIQGDNQDFMVELDRRYEIYGLHLGLVYKEDIKLQYCTNTDCLGQQQVETGHEYRQYLIESGTN
ncbi:hypothetical protein C900_01227 [Fulvivirga imtechensis AK7]|uniref:Lipoprotein n=1 Tax=Fulvivirga imtechensis AK7 TaxID=1237149 RepID=L8JWH5_9BACT|nr:hypothetical protein [Fulvivirga imtechensis]ELR72553.1 hypothetical protein C900_01227 [Fulvivirga imtechensis AK7]